MITKKDMETLQRGDVIWPLPLGNPEPKLLPVTYLGPGHLDNEDIEVRLDGHEHSGSYNRHWFIRSRARAIVARQKAARERIAELEKEHAREITRLKAMLPKEER